VRVMLLMTVLVACLFGCGPELAPQEQVVLEVGGRKVTLDELDRFVATSAQRELPFLPGDVMAALLDQFIEEQLLLLAADDAGIEVEPLVLEQELQFLSPKDSISSIRSDNAGFVESVKQKLRIERLLEIEVLGALEVTEEEIAFDYEENRAYYSRPETAEISQILVEEETLAGEIRQELGKKPDRFEELAREVSIGPEASLGGKMGSFGRGELPSSLEREVFTLKSGRLSEVVATDFGFHIFRLDRLVASRPLELEEVADVIRVESLRRKSDEAISLYTESLRERYPVRVFRDHLSFAFLEPDEIPDERDLEEEQ
jgi:peptidyl-prolyl cis-trans isomerase C